MNVTQQIGLALDLVLEHLNMPDKSGEPTYLHSIRVGISQRDHPVAMTVGFLHDLIEDSNITINDLTNMGFDREVVQTVQILTHPDGEPYQNVFIKRVLTNEVAVRVKIADIMDNLARLRRDLNNIPPKDADRMRNKWETALRTLQNHLLDVNTNGWHNG